MKKKEGNKLKETNICFFTTKPEVLTASQMGRWD
jgi:hypothetical protein